MHGTMLTKAKKIVEKCGFGEFLEEPPVQKLWIVAWFFYIASLFIPVSKHAFIGLLAALYGLLLPLEVFSDRMSLDEFGAIAPLVFTLAGWSNLLILMTPKAKVSRRKWLRWAVIIGMLIATGVNGSVSILFAFDLGAGYYLWLASFVMVTTVLLLDERQKRQ